MRLKGPKGKETRPTEDRIKESLFNILYDIDGESIVLDLFSGSGSIGLEFLSRGAKKAYFVDISSNSIMAIRENIRHTKYEDRSIIIKNDFLKTIDYLNRKNILFDYIYIDPPYEKGLIVKALEKISNSNILNADGNIIIEHESELELEDEIFRFKKIKDRSYGTKTISFYK